MIIIWHLFYFLLFQSFGLYSIRETEQFFYSVRPAVSHAIERSVGDKLPPRENAGAYRRPACSLLS